MRLRFVSALQFVTALVLVAALAPLCSAQQSISGTRNPRPDSTQRELQRTLERDLLFREMQEMAAHGPAPAQPLRRQSLTQINEDFARIQMANNALAQAAASGGELDPKFVAQAAAEIKKRAARLKNNLLLPETDEPRPKAKAEIEPTQLKSALTTLDGLVISFVSNPGFQSVGVIDAQWSLKARRDLEEIIELSARVKSCSEQLQKASQKSR